MANLIGARVERKEDKKFLTGKGRYTADINLAHQTYAYFVRSPHARAKITKVDISKASKASGVVKILTGDDLVKDKIGGLIAGWKIVSQDGKDMKVPPHPPLAKDSVNFVGDHVAVVVAETLEQAEEAVRDMLSGNAFGEAGCRVVIEEFLEGEEASFIVIADGKNILPMATSQDHKRVGNGDTGPNTGGMGAYSPAPVVTPEIHDRIMKEVIEPTIKGMEQEGNDYTGFLYAGLMISKDGEAKVIEYNCRFGDPETQPIMMRLKSDLVSLCDAALDKVLDKTNTEWDDRAAVGVVLAAGGYPESYEKGMTISGLNQNTNPNSKIFHAGTKMVNNEVTSVGGRVLCATALADSVTAAQQDAYTLANQISWKDMFFRSDIAYRAIDREKLK